MGLHSDFFALDENELATVLRGWKRPAPPLDAEREVTGKNPFTGEDLVIRTRANPEQPVADEDAVQAPELHELENVVSWKWITQFEAAELVTAAGVASTLDDGIEKMRYTELIGPVGAYGSVFELPNELVQALTQTSDGEIRDLAARWTALRDEDAYPPWSEDDLAELVRDLAALACRASRSGRRLYLHCGEP